MFIGYCVGAQHSLDINDTECCGTSMGTEKVGSSLHSALELSQVCAANRATAESKGWWAQNRKESGPRTGRAKVQKN